MGIAATEAEAIALAASERPDCAVVDIRLASGDGRIVAKVLAAQGVAVLFATGHCQEMKDLAYTGALGCLPKPYSADNVPAALVAICHHRRGDRAVPLPDSRFLLDAA